MVCVVRCDEKKLSSFRVPIDLMASSCRYPARRGFANLNTPVESRIFSECPKSEVRLVLQMVNVLR